MSFSQKIKTMISKTVIFLKTVPCLISKLTIRKQNWVIFGSWFGEKYSDNPKYLFEYFLKEGEFHAVWITSNENVYKYMRAQKLPVFLKHSVMGVFYQLHSKFAISSTGYWDYARKLTGGCVQIQLWHGVGGGKKIGLDDKEHLNDVDIYQINLNISISKKTYFLGTSSSMKEVFHSAYKVPYQNFIKAGQPRNDLFLIKDFKPVTFNPIIFKGKKVIGYYPTHRNSGKLHIEVNKLFNLVEINAFCEKNGCIFVIKKHFYHRNEKEELEQYSNIIDLTSCNVDTNELLAFTDYLITDYSSISTDYLLLGRPIFYYCFDLEEYLKNDRKMYWKYESITPGPKCKNYNELIKALSNVIENNDDIYINKRREVCDFFFDHEYAQNKRACPIVYNFIKNYNKKSKRNVRKI